MRLVFAGEEISEEITIPELRQHLIFLSSDSLKGRRPGTPEDRIAANYIVEQLQEDSVLLLGDHGLQSFPVTISVHADSDNALSFDGFYGTLKQDFVPLSFSSNDTLTAAVAFVGYGFDFSNDSLAWHDYENIDVHGKWALILRGDPHSGSGDNPFSLYNEIRRKIMVAKDNGAAGVLLVSGETFEKSDNLMDVAFEYNQPGVGIPVLQIKRTVVDRLLKSDSTLAFLERQLNQNQKPVSFILDMPVSAVTHVEKRFADTYNILAMLPGSDPILKDEVVVLGAHYDHLGFGGPGSGSRRPDTLAIHNGADDNASGVSAILEIFERLSFHKQDLRRSVVCVAFGAEESGSVGSKFFVNSGVIPVTKIKFMFNLDMVGRMEIGTKSLSVSGVGTAVGLRELVDKVSGSAGIETKCSTEGYGPSDHASFYNKDIPVLFFMTSMHEDYHTPFDDFDAINFDGLKIVADYVYDLVYAIANRPEAVVFQEAGPKSKPAMRGRMKVTLGIMPDITSTDIKGVRADLVIKDRPAARAGMQKGDIIISLEGKPVNNIYEYMYRLSDFHTGQRISVEVMRGDKKVILIVEL